MKHPMQKIEIDKQGVARFVENRIVRMLVDRYPGNLNAIVCEFNAGYREDYEQLMMLIGYSVSGFGDLPSSSKRRVTAADKAAAKLR